MPIMNGIELIKSVKAINDDIEFIVLSGYGEYEYTSQAMEEGIRHYLLKPCDEEKIAQIVVKLIREIDEKRKKLEDQKAYMTTVHTLLPRAREQVFRNMLLGKEQLTHDYQILMNEIGEVKNVEVLAVGCQKDLDYLEQFIVSNVFHELMEHHGILLETSIGHRVLFLMKYGYRDRDEAVF